MDPHSPEVQLHTVEEDVDQRDGCAPSDPLLWQDAAAPVADRQVHCVVPFVAHPQITIRVTRVWGGGVYPRKFRA